MRPKNIVIIGCGDIGRRVANLAQHQSTRIAALVRNSEKLTTQSLGITEIVSGNLDHPEALPELATNGSVILYTVPPPGGGIVDSRVKTFCSFLDKGDGVPQKLVYISTTSVYGDCGDDIINEERMVNPTNHMGMRRLDAEQRFTSWGRAHGVPVIILRVAGIYGPGRIPLDRISSRHPLLNEAEAGYSNRIHAEDLARVCLAAMDKGEDGDIFNVCDGETSKMTDYFNAITDLLGLPRLPQVPLNEAREVMTPLMFGYLTESRRVDNRRMLAKLGITLRYPTLRDGLKASL